MLAGTAVAVGLWGVLQLLGLGAGLASIDPDNVDSARHAAVGTGAWSVIAPLLSLLAGGYIAAKLANTYDNKVAGAHGVVVWGLSAVIGLFSTLALASVAAHGASNAASGMPQKADQVQVVDYNAEAQDALVPINNRLKLACKAQISPEQLMMAVRGATDDGKLDREEFVEELDDNTALNEENSKLVADMLGPRAEGLIHRSPAATPQQHDALKAAESTGKGLLALAISILLSLGTAILGAILALKRFGRDNGGGRDSMVRDREDNVLRDREVHTTAPYPTTPTPPVSGAV